MAAKTTTSVAEEVTVTAPGAKAAIDSIEAAAEQQASVVHGLTGWVTWRQNAKRRLP